MNPKKRTGTLGEQFAARVYEKRGYKLLEHNFTTRFGEVDLILEKDGVLVFCEVKTRGAQVLGSPAEAVNRYKQGRVQKAAQLWLAEKALHEPLMRFDVAEVSLPGEKTARVKIIENAF